MSEETKRKPSVSAAKLLLFVMVCLGATTGLAISEKAVKHEIVSVGAVRPMLKLSTRTFRKPLELFEDAKPRLVAALDAPPTDTESPAVLLRVEGIKPPKDVPLTFEVFLAKKGEKPSKKSYVGSISFFGRRGHGHEDEKGFDQGFDVTKVVQWFRTANKGTLPELEVTINPHSTTGLSDEELAKKDIEVPIVNITLMLAEVEKQ